MFIILLLIALKLITSLDNFIVTIGPLTQQTTTYIVYENGKLNDQFDIGNTIMTNCAPLSLMYFKSDLSQQIAYTPLQLINQGEQTITIKKILLETLDGQNLPAKLNVTNNIKIIPNNETKINIQYICQDKLTKQNYWSVLKLTLLFENGSELLFHYQYICDPNYHPTRFDWSYLLLISIMSLFMLILSRQQKISAFKIKYYEEKSEEKIRTFQGIHLGIKTTIIYNTIFLMIVIIALIFQRKAEKIMEYIVRTICLICGFLYLSDVFYKFSLLKIKIIWKIRICDTISLIFCSITLYYYIILNEPWILSNILTIFLVGCSIKLFKVISLKTAVQFFVPCIIMDILFSIYAIFYVRYEWDSLVMKYFNTPLTAQFPYFYPIYKKRCGWLSITSILFPTFFLAYAHRFDRFKDSIVYRMISYFGLVIGLILWFTFSSLYSLPLPVSSFTLFPTLGISAIIAFQRNEIRTMWNGDFYDQVLYNPWRHQVQQDGRNSVHMIVKKQTLELMNLNPNQIESENLIRMSKGEIKLNNQLFEGLLD